MGNFGNNTSCQEGVSCKRELGGINALAPKYTLDEGRTSMLALQPNSKTHAHALFNGRSAHQAKQPEGHPSPAGTSPTERCKATIAHAMPLNPNFPNLQGMDGRAMLTWPRQAKTT